MVPSVCVPANRSIAGASAAIINFGAGVLATPTAPRYVNPSLELTLTDSPLSKGPRIDR